MDTYLSRIIQRTGSSDHSASRLTPVQAPVPTAEVPGFAPEEMPTAVVEAKPNFPVRIDADKGEPEIGSPAVDRPAAELTVQGPSRSIVAIRALSPETAVPSPEFGLAPKINLPPEWKEESTLKIREAFPANVEPLPTKMERPPANLERLPTKMEPLPMEDGTPTIQMRPAETSPSAPTEENDRTPGRKSFPPPESVDLVRALYEPSLAPTQKPTPAETRDPLVRLTPVDRMIPLPPVPVENRIDASKLTIGKITVEVMPAPPVKKTQRRIVRQSPPARPSGSPYPSKLSFGLGQL